MVAVNSQTKNAFNIFLRQNYDLSLCQVSISQTHAIGDVVRATVIVFAEIFIPIIQQCKVLLLSNLSTK